MCYKNDPNKEEHIDIDQVLKKTKGGNSEAEIFDVEDASGGLTTIREAFADKDIVR